MRLYLMRHAIAEPRIYPPIGPDFERALTPKGRSRMKQQATGLLRLGERVDLILTSPLVRSRQTADILAAVCSPTPEIEVHSGLAPGGDYMTMIDEVADRVREKGLALVGHQPDMGEMASVLISGADDAEIDFKKGAIARIDIDDDADALVGKLCWYLAPRQLRAIAKGEQV